MSSVVVDATNVVGGVGLFKETLDVDLSKWFKDYLFKEEVHRKKRKVLC